MGLKDWITPTNHAVDFECADCGTSFSKELAPGEHPNCPECGSEQTERAEPA